MSTLAVKSCGPMTSLQDGGRIGAARLGMSRSGAMDGRALAYANARVGNRPGEGAVEFMLAGGTFEVTGGTVRVALAGALAILSVDGAAVPPGQSATIAPGQVLTVGPARAGVFSYLALAGGLDVPMQLGSVSLQPRAAIGGLEGRALRPGDRLPLASRQAPGGPEMRLDLPPFDRESAIRVVLGPQADYFEDAAISAFLSSTYTVSAEADRMGYRLSGPALAHARGFNIVSDGLVAGSVQVPGSGVPIVMMADHQTTGGYPKIATVVSADLGMLAQRRPGDAVRFAAVPVAVAEALARERSRDVSGLPARLAPVRAGLPSVEELLGLNLAGDATDAFADPFAA